MPQVLHDVAARALQLHGSLGITDEMPLAAMVLESFSMGLADGPTEVHKLVLARAGAEAAPGVRRRLSRTRHVPRLRQLAQQRYADALADLGEL